MGACNQKQKQSDAKEISSSNETGTNLPLILTEEILSHLQMEEYEAFSNYFHPTLGVRFSPYGYVDTINDVQLSASEFLEKIEQNSIIHWGSYDGTGDPIKLTVEDYFNEFVYNKDFLNAERISLNEILGTGNSLINLESVYKESDFTESHFSGFEEKYGGMDWASLRLIFKKWEGKYYLVGVVNDRWTI